MPSLQQIIRIGYNKIADTKPFPRFVRRAVEWIVMCRTAALGGHVQACPEGHFERIQYNSCKHRFCPTCAYTSIERWLERQKARILACEHYHVIFTLPGELDRLWRANVREMTELLFQAARDTIFELLADAKYLGVEPGMIIARHTWGQTLVLHPHVHCLVTGGGLTADGHWRAVRNGYLLPGRVVRDLFRGKFLAAARKSLERGKLRVPEGQRPQQILNLFNKLGRKKWNVSIRERYADGSGVLKYLGRYLRGAPISERRIVAWDEKKVRFRYKDNRAGKESGRTEMREMELPIEQFVERLLEHVPGPGHKLVRSYGLYAASRLADLQRCRALLGQPRFEAPEPADWQTCVERAGGNEAGLCPVCGAKLVVREVLTPLRDRPRKLPMRRAA